MFSYHPPPSKQTTSFLLFEAWIPVIHNTHSPPFLSSLSLHVSLPCTTPPSSSYSTRPSSPSFFLAHVFLFSSWAIMESLFSTCDSLFHQPKPDREKKKKKKSNACVSFSVSSDSVGPSQHAPQGALLTSAVSIETCQPATQFLIQGKKNGRLIIHSPPFEFRF